MAAEKRALLDLPVDKRAGARAGAAGRECDKGYESHGMRNGHEVQSDDVWLQRVAGDVWTCGVEAQSKWPRRAARYGFGRSG